MSREKEIAILMADNSTREEAEKHLDRGTVIYDSPEEYVETQQQDAPELLQEDMEAAGCGTVEGYVKYLDGLKSGDMVTVDHEGHKYFVVYAL